MADPARVFPLKRPLNHRPPVPRWQLVIPPGVTHLFTAYVGIQKHKSNVAADTKAIEEVEAHIKAWIDDQNGDEPAATERFRCIDGHDVPGSTIWVLYWYNEQQHKSSLQRLNLAGVYFNLDDEVQVGIGLWCEAFTSAVTRLETNYTGTDYLPGLARLPETKTEEHTLTAYWGAARDRIPDAAFNQFPASNPLLHLTSKAKGSGSGQATTATNYENLVHIRSGQYWEECEQDEAEAYERQLEPALVQGLQHLWNSPDETGAMGIRYLRNWPDGEASRTAALRKESCVTGFFTSLASLEKWAHTHKSHLAIYRGAMNHAKVFGQDRKLRTWHEVSVLERGAVEFQYINCLNKTGVLAFLDPS